MSRFGRRSFNPPDLPDAHYGAQSETSRVPQSSPNFREEAEKIVADERQQSEKMPVYEVRTAHIEVKYRADSIGARAIPPG